MKMGKKQKRVLILVVFVIIAVVSFYFIFFVGAVSPSTEIVDSTDDVGLYNSIAIDSNGKIHISYQDRTNSDLRYCNNVAGSWNCETLELTGNVGGHTSITIDSNDKIHISHMDNTDSVFVQLRYCNNVAGSWSCVDVDGTQMGVTTSITIDSNDFVHIAHRDANSNNLDLRYCNNVAGSWSCVNPETLGAAGLFPSIAIDSNGKVHISNVDGSASPSYFAFDLRYCNNVGGSWSCSDLDTANINGVTSLAIDSNDKIHISYREGTNDDLKYCTDSSGSFSCTIIEDGGETSSLAIDSNDKIHILHLDSTNDDLRYCNNVNGTFVCEKLADVSSIGVPNGRAIAIKKGRIVDSTSFSEKIHISWYNDTDLMYTSLDPFNPTSQFESQTTSAGNFSQSFISANVTANDAVALDTIIINVYNSTGLVISNSSQTSPFFFNFTGLADGTYFLNTTVNDTSNNLNQTETRTIVLDTTGPTVNFTSPTGPSGTGSNQSFIVVNLTATDSLVGLSSIITRLYNSSGSLLQSNISSTSPFFINYTGLSDGLYFYNITMNDTLNNINNTVTRNFTLDSISPTAAFECSPSSVTVGDVVTCTCSGTDSGIGINDSATSSSLAITTTVTGTFIVSGCSVSDLVGHSANTTGTYSVTAVSSSSVGGSGGGTTTTTETTITESYSITKITSEEETVIEVTDEEIGITEIIIKASGDLENVKLTINKYDSKPEGVTQDKSGEVYRYLEINAENLDENFEKAIVRFEVEKSWALENNITKENIALFKFDNVTENWDELDSVLLSEDDTFYFYEAELTSFSFFVIGEKLSLVESIVSGISDSYEKASQSKLGLFIFWGVILILIIVIILISVVVVNLIRRKEEVVTQSQ